MVAVAVGEQDRVHADRFLAGPGKRIAAEEGVDGDLAAAPFPLTEPSRKFPE
jgi:hypothetical protein